MSFWVGMKAGKYDADSVVEAVDPTPQQFPEFSYMVGPFATREEADIKLVTEKLTYHYLEERIWMVCSKRFPAIHDDLLYPVDGGTRESAATAREEARDILKGM